MSTSIIVLSPGYSRWIEKPKSMLANGSCTLVRTGTRNILVDTLGPWDRDNLLNKLANTGLCPEDIDTVIVTHLHTDHIGNLNLFPASDQIVGDQQNKGDHFTFDIFENNSSINLCNHVQLYLTPGHTENDVSLVVHNVDQLGTVAITGDLFESEADLQNESVWLDAGSTHPQLQRTNRQLILSMVDYIVPGHGPMFKINK